MSTQELEPARQITVVNGDVEFDVEVLVELEDEEATYALVTPLYPIIDIACVEGDEQLRDLEPDEVTKIWKHLIDALKPHGLKPLQSAGDILLQGTASEDFYESCDMIDLVTENGTEQWLEVIRLETGDTTYVVLTPLTPIMYGVELNDDKGRLLEDDELEQLHDEFSLALADMFDDDEDDELIEDELIEDETKQASGED